MLGGLSKSDVYAMSYPELLRWVDDILTVWLNVKGVDPLGGDPRA
jgi:hypothetical protein